MSAFIKLENISVKFKIYHNSNPSLKEAAINLLTGKKNLNTYREFYALNQINLDIRTGDRLGLIGLNGAGKSTLLKTISGIYRPHQGKLSVGGKITPLMELGAGFDPEQTGKKNILLYGALLGYSQEIMHIKEKEIIEFSELEDFMDLPLKYYSSGMSSRLAFSIATVTDPEILIIDEVFAAGDAHFVEKSSNRIKQMVAKSSMLVMVSHTLSQIEDLCNRVVYLDHGNILMDGNPQEVISLYEKKIEEMNTR
ncbi:MAG: ABC transporter ATP-binding protein [Anaerolineales bacterium]|nr:ABC transporter ATP-binding protein [Anaerolineales bacterium]MCZ2121259.1 ABC transporter ATP-binding protein [Anaerolineales bacterium]